MCAPVVQAVASAIPGVGVLAAQSQTRRAKENQDEAIKAQNAKQNEASALTASIGPSSKAIDLTKESSMSEDLKRNKIAMQQGIMGTSKTNPMTPLAPVATQKTTLGN